MNWNKDGQVGTRTWQRGYPQIHWRQTRFLRTDIGIVFTSSLFPITFRVGSRGRNLFRIRLLSMPPVAISGSLTKLVFPMERQYWQRTGTQWTIYGRESVLRKPLISTQTKAWAQAAFLRNLLRNRRKPKKQIFSSNYPFRNTYPRPRRDLLKCTVNFACVKQWKVLISVPEVFGEIKSFPFVYI